MKKQSKRHMGFYMRQCREQREVQQEALACRLKRSKSCLSKVENGWQEPDIDLVIGYANALGCPQLLDIHCRDCAVAQAKARFADKKAA